jgi:hypothetical protein
MRRVPHPLVALVVAAAALAGVACSSSSTPTVKPDTAAATVADVYKLDQRQQQCLAQGFSHDEAATRPLAANRAASDADLAALGRVADACIPVSVLATAIVGGASEGGNTLTSAQQSCLRQAVGRLSASDRATLLAGLAVPTALGDIQTALLGKVTDGLLNTCQISIPGVTQQDTTPSPSSTSSASTSSTASPSGTTG